MDPHGQEGPLNGDVYIGHKLTYCNITKIKLITDPANFMLNTFIF